MEFAHWKITICDMCRQDESLLEPRLIGVMENGRWVGGFTQENLTKAKQIRGEWEKEITCPCIVFCADMETTSMCEKHLNEIISKKNEQLGINDEIKSS